ncbi:hypothetical protein [Streptomyces lavendulocolor]|uniref:hypothetical protein n=1 Tax=Streptomyces lavendulocolor TaxID=67316 RepID=UPI0033C6BAB6
MLFPHRRLQGDLRVEDFRPEMQNSVLTQGFDVVEELDRRDHGPGDQRHGGPEPVSQSEGIAFLPPLHVVMHQSP